MVLLAETTGQLQKQKAFMPGNHLGQVLKTAPFWDYARWEPPRPAESTHPILMARLHPREAEGVGVLKGQTSKVGFPFQPKAPGVGW